MTPLFKGPQRIGARISLTYSLLLIAALSFFAIGTSALLFLQMRAQLVHFAVQDVETVEGLMSIAPDGRFLMRDDYHNHPESKRVLEHYLEVLAPDGTILYRNDRLGSLKLGGAIESSEGVGGYSPRSISLPDGTPLVIVSRRHNLQGRTVIIRLAHSEEPVWHALKQFWAAAAVMFPVMLLLAAAVGFRMSHRILAPVRSIASQAELITSSRLHERIPTNGTGDELDQLAETFNRTLTRLDLSFTQLRQFTADASHELRTPLAAIRSVGEVGLARDGSREEYRELVASMLEEVNRLTRLVEELLLIARGDAGVIPLNLRPLKVVEFVRDTIALLEPLAEEKSQRLELLAPLDEQIQADPLFLRQALINVLHNAIKYSPVNAKTVVRIEYGPASHGVMIAVHDEGPGLSPEQISRVFDRFYRVDQGRSRDAGGFGLGLAIAQWAVKAHQGKFEITSTPGAGSEFRILLPAASKSDQRSA